MKNRSKILVMLIVLLLSITTISAREPVVDEISNSNAVELTIETTENVETVKQIDDLEHVSEKDALESSDINSTNEEMGTVYVFYGTDNSFKELESLKIEGLVGTSYKVEILDFEGYVFREVNEEDGFSPLEGTITNGFQFVEVLYESKLYSSLNFGIYINDGVLADDIRPDTVSYVVRRTNSKTNESTIIKEETVDISAYSMKQPVLYEWEILDYERYDEQGNEYIFEIEAEPLDGYTVETRVNRGYENCLYLDIIYTAIVDYIDIQFYKEFGPEFEIQTRDLKEETERSLIPEFVSIHLLRNGEEVEESPIILSEKNGWSKTLEHLPNVDAEGNLYHYEVYEKPLEGFKSEINVIYTHDHPEYNSRTVAFEIRNHFIKDVTVNKKWIGGPEEKPAVELQLFGKWGDSALGQTEVIEKIGGPIVLNNKKTSYTWYELPYFDYEDIYSPKEITYFVEEVNVPQGYEVSYSDDGLTIVNTFNGEGIMEHIAGEKIWNDFEDNLGLRPDSITLELYAEGELLKSLIVTEADDWKYDFGLYKKYHNNELVEYEIKETVVPHYSSEIDGYTVINTIVPIDKPPIKPDKPTEEVPVKPEIEKPNVPDVKPPIVDTEKTPVVTKPESLETTTLNKDETPKTSVFQKDAQKYIASAIIAFCVISLSYVLKRKNESM